MLSPKKSSAARACISMFDWPEHSHTSPINTSEIVCVAPDFALAVSV